MPNVKCFVLIAENVVGKKQMGAEMAHAFDSSNTTEGYFFGQRSHDMLNGGGGGCIPCYPRSSQSLA